MSKASKARNRGQPWQSGMLIGGLIGVILTVALVETISTGRAWYRQAAEAEATVVAQAEAQAEVDRKETELKDRLAEEYRLKLKAAELELKVKVERALREEDIAHARSEWDRVARAEPSRVSFGVPLVQQVYVRNPFVNRRVIVQRSQFGFRRSFARPTFFGR